MKPQPEAIVEVDRMGHHLGVRGTPESKAKYRDWTNALSYAVLTLKRYTARALRL